MSRHFSNLSLRSTLREEGEPWLWDSRRNGGSSKLWVLWPSTSSMASVSYIKGALWNKDMKASFVGDSPRSWPTHCWTHLTLLTMNIFWLSPGPMPWGTPSVHPFINHTLSTYTHYQLFLPFLHSYFKATSSLQLELWELRNFHLKNCWVLTRWNFVVRSSMKVMKNWWGLTLQNGQNKRLKQNTCLWIYLFYGEKNTGSFVISYQIKRPHKNILKDLVMAHMYRISQRL